MVYFAYLRLPLIKTILINRKFLLSYSAVPITTVAMLLLYGLLFVAVYTITMVLFTNCSNYYHGAVYILCDGIAIIQHVVYNYCPDVPVGTVLDALL